MKFRYLLPLAFVALFFAGCEVEGDTCTSNADCGAGELCQNIDAETGEGECVAQGEGCTGGCPDGQSCQNGTCVDDTVACNPECAAGEICVNGVCEGGTVLLDYRYVRIDDVSGNSDDIDGGADIDAIVLFKADGTSAYADSVEGFEHGGGFGTEVNPQDALGAPDAFEDYMSSGSADNCRVDSGYVSLGGTGGYLITGFATGVKMEAGDDLVVLEVGGCDFDGGTAIIDPVDVFVSVANDINDQWQVVGEAQEGPEMVFSLTAADLPPVEAN